LGKVIRLAGQVDLPGKGWTITRLEVKDAKEAGPAFVLVAANKLPKGNRVVSCTGLSQGESACKRAMQAAAQTAWRAGPPAALPRTQSATPMFASRPYKVPKGCEVIKQQNATAIACEGDPVLFWAQQAEAFATLDDVMTGKLFESGMKEAARVPCWIGGVSTNCRSFLPTVIGQQRSAYVGQATVRDQPVMVICFAGATFRPLPPACAAVLSLTRPKP
jgi:hypothetical protein